MSFSPPMKGLLSTECDPEAKTTQREIIPIVKIIKTHHPNPKYDILYLKRFFKPSYYI